MTTITKDKQKTVINDGNRLQDFKRPFKQKTVINDGNRLQDQFKISFNKELKTALKHVVKPALCDLPREH